MIEMIRDHEQDLSDFQRLRYSARDPEIRDLAASGVSTIQQHLTLARQVGSQVGVATTAGRVGTTSPTPYPCAELQRGRPAPHDDRRGSQRGEPPE